MNTSLWLAVITIVFTIVGGLTGLGITIIACAWKLANIIGGLKEQISILVTKHVSLEERVDKLEGKRRRG